MDEELNEELQFHLEIQARKHRAQAIDAAEAQRYAALQFGGCVRATEECRNAMGTRFLETTGRDIRYSLPIRLALGARPATLLGAALVRPLKLLAYGSAAGLLVSFLASRVLEAVVYQATPRDPFVLAGVVLAMVLVGLLATWIPAQRALATDPAMLLRGRMIPPTSAVPDKCSWGCSASSPRVLPPSASANGE